MFPRFHLGNVILKEGLSSLPGRRSIRRDAPPSIFISKQWGSSRETKNNAVITITFARFFFFRSPSPQRSAVNSALPSADRADRQSLGLGIKVNIPGEQMQYSENVPSAIRSRSPHYKLCEKGHPADFVFLSPSMAKGPSIVQGFIPLDTYHLIYS
ncbi:hypothetical protein NPIL_477581 [Nephila pilipes]|uniref:Uncharacterized protein n=1 Tax=Nephila pilipes TaxID=299642 RepID=A0A8X6PRN1_NEPPI|nr:hypothetical protein NPIL_477581 [Nephila pilipes]